MQFSKDNILSLAPDRATFERGESLATERKWRNLEGNDKAIWGECKSSGVSYYKTQIELKGSSFKCNCPSRKIPCKHSLGLFLLYINNSGAFRISEKMPTWVKDWLENKKITKPDENVGRSQEEEKRLAEARLKTREKRLRQMASGLDELEIWLMDTIRQGLATIEGQSNEYWNELSSRMVDAKLGSLARRIKGLQNLAGQEAWHEKMLTELGEMYLVLKGFRNMEKLPPALQQELLNVAGINYKKEDLLEIKGIEDTWFVVGQIEGNEDDSLFYRRSWIYGDQTKKFALILDFAWGTTPYSENWKVGQQFKGSAIFYPSAFPLRVLIKNFEMVAEPFTIFGYLHLTAFGVAYSSAIGENPWLQIFPAFLENVKPIFHEKEFYLIDEDGKQILIKNVTGIGWKMMALSGGHLVNIFGEWDGKVFMPLSAIINNQFYLLWDAEPLARPSRSWGRY